MMKVLLLGEYSGLHLNLSKGLEESQVEVTFLSDGDKWKRISSGDMTVKGITRYDRFLWSVGMILLNWRRLSGYDIVQYISSDLYNPLLMRLIGLGSRKRVFLAAGSDSMAVLQFLKQPYSPLQAEVKAMENRLLKRLNQSRIKNNLKMESWIDAVITTSATYHYAYEFSDKRIGPIPMPICLDGRAYKPNQVNRKIKIFHGISRRAFKGSDIILDAMERLQREYPDQVENVVVEKLPLEQYLNIMDEANIVVDQAYSMGYGMNALYGLASGRIVLSGTNPSLEKLFGMDSCPIVNIEPSSEQIYQSLVRIVNSADKDPDLIQRLGRKSRAFVQQYHCCEKVGRQYMDTWSGLVYEASK